MFRKIFPILYALLVLAALIFMFATAHATALCGIYAILVTLPWSMLCFYIIGVTVGTGLFDHSIIPGTVVICFCALINLWLFYLLGRKLDHDASRVS